VFSVDLDQPTVVVERLDTFLPAEERNVSAPIRVYRVIPPGVYEKIS